MTDVVFQREMLPLGEFLKINLDIRVEQVVMITGNACNGYQNE